ncbi:unnamed protein product [Caenorhabditis angaria]|uniref:Uncharacterized protein n=1 Tax=Caenorhabditis angaria TaxID=860376 RepID=A0A9P1IMR6_9PELO|nr:unnamed protein product [Caenorhabditis angaria]
MFRSLVLALLGAAFVNAQIDNDDYDSPIEKFAHNVGSWFHLQSSMDNRDYVIGVQKLIASLNPNKFTADLCGAAKNVDTANFLLYLDLQRRRFQATPSDIFEDRYGSRRRPFRVRIFNDFQFDIHHTLYSIMNYKFINTRIEIGGGCEDTEFIDSDADESSWIRVFNQTAHPLDYVKHFISIFPFAEAIDESDERLHFFTNNFVAFIDTNSEVRYDLDMFMKYMARFNTRYVTRKADYVDMRTRPRYTVITEDPDHVVFQYIVHFEHLSKTVEPWELEVEAINVGGFHGWRIAKIFIRPPFNLWKDNHYESTKRTADELLELLGKEVTRVISRTGTSSFYGKYLELADKNKSSICPKFKGPDAGLSFTFGDYSGMKTTPYIWKSYVTYDKKSVPTGKIIVSYEFGISHLFAWKCVTIGFKFSAHEPVYDEFHVVSYELQCETKC